MSLYVDIWSMDTTFKQKYDLLTDLLEATQAWRREREGRGEEEGGWQYTSRYLTEKTCSLTIYRYALPPPHAGSVGDPHWFQSGSESSILCQCGSSFGSTICIQGINYQICFLQLKKLNFLDKKLWYLFLGLHEGRPSYRRSLESSKRIFSTSKKEISSSLSSIFVDNFCPPGSGSGSSRSQSMRIHLQHW